MRYRMLSFFALVSLASCVSMPEVSVRTVQLLTAKTEVSDNFGNTQYIKGYLLFTLESDSDLAKLAVENNSLIVIHAETCSSQLKIDTMPYVYANKPQSNLAVIAYKGNVSAPYNLATQPEDICLTVGLGGNMNPLKRARINLRYSISDSLVKSLRAYEQEDGVMEIRPSPKCEHSLCIPQYGPNPPGYSP